MLKRISLWAIAILLAWATAVSGALADDDKLKKEELDQLLAPVALYPDELLTNVLIASTYPLDVVQAARWRSEPANAKLKGDALVKALEAKEWDPSIKTLVQFPDVLKQMSDKLEWTQKLGDAFLAQQSEVMDQIQFLRSKADEAGNLKSNKQQKVVKESGSGGAPVYIIEPATPETVYVPVYQPEVVYGDWWYPDYPPYYWGYPGASFVNGVYWAAGIAIAAGIWDWNHFDWRRHDIDIDVDKWNKINVNRARITSDQWEHRPDHRGAVPYRNKEVREKFGKETRAREASKEFRGRDAGDLDRAKIEQRLKETDHAKISDKAGEKIRDKADGKAGSKAGDKVKDRAGDRAGTRDKKVGKAGSGNVNRDLDRARARKPPPGAFDVKRGQDVKRFAERGHASRAVAARGRVGGGGGMHRGGGGGRRR